MKSLQGGKTHGDGLDSGHSEEVVGVRPHAHNLGNDGSLRPLYTEDLSQIPQVDGCRFSDAVDGIPQPRHAKVAKLLVKHGFAELLGQQGDILDDRLPDTS